jgi:alpha-beta hydrolase superfamily lysophospholipase
VAQKFLDQDAVVRTLFYPRRELRVPDGDAHLVSVMVDSGVLVYGRFHLADPAAPVLLFFHGNGEIASDYDPLAGLFTQAGVSLLVMDYRGYGLSGGEPSTSNLFRDAVTIFDALPDLLARRCQSTQVFVMGRSLGGAAALELADRRHEKVAGVIIESGFAFTRSWLARIGWPLGQYDEERDGHGNAQKIARYTGPTLILHGQADSLITPDQATALYEASGAQDKHLLVVPNADHNNLMIVGSVPYFSALRSLVASQGGKEAGLS